MFDLETLKNRKILGVGCSTFGGSTSRKDAERILEYSFDSGLNYYDVARSYGYGRAESIVGKFAKNKRDKIIIASKFGILPPKDFPFKNLLIAGARKFKHLIPQSNNAAKYVSGKILSNHLFTPELAVKSLEKSLRELGADYLDVFLLHESKFSDMLLEDVIYALKKEKEKGKFRALGGTFYNRSDLLSISHRPDLAEVIQFPFGLDQAFSATIKRSGFIQVIYSILNYNLVPKDSSSAERLLDLKFKFPELAFVENFPALKLFLAFSDITAGVLLISSKSQKNIDKNLLTIQQPVLTPNKLKEVKEYFSNNNF
jgi:aryl-alcohol dehydrogenase-like predicted oxidoreductase